MINKLKCPFCGEEIVGVPNLAQTRTIGFRCYNIQCKAFNHFMPVFILQALIQTKQDLEIARKALESISGVRGNIEDYYGGVSIHYQQMVLHMDEIATNALEQIEHKE